MAWLPSLESFNYILIVFNTAQLYLLPTTVCSISPLSAVYCCLTFNQNKKTLQDSSAYKVKIKLSCIYFPKPLIN